MAHTRKRSSVAQRRSRIVKLAKKGKDIGKKGKMFQKIMREAAKRYGSVERGRRVAAAAMWRSLGLKK